MSRGLGPAMVGTNEWKLAKSKVTAAKEFSLRIKEEHHQYLRPGRKNSAKEDLQRRLL
ncbi:MAG: hypothetical protein ACKO96_25430 [Flammeovirgaceae bacterium]